MTCFGRAYVHWSEVENVGHRGGRQRVEAVEYNGEEEYFQFRFNLWPRSEYDIELNYKRYNVTFYSIGLRIELRYNHLETIE